MGFCGVPMNYFLPNESKDDVDNGLGFSLINEEDIEDLANDLDNIDENSDQEVNKPITIN